MKTKIIAGLGIVLLIFLAGCTAEANDKKGTSLADLALKDPQQEFVGQYMTDLHWKDAVRQKSWHFDEVNEDKIIIIQTFADGCPSCLEGIKSFNNLLAKHPDDIEVMMIDIIPEDTEEDLLRIKEQYNGGDWHWIAYQGSLIPLYDNYNMVVPDMTIIVDKGGKIVYADSYYVPIEELEENVLADLLAQ